MRTDNINVISVRIITSRWDKLTFELVLQGNGLFLARWPGGAVTGHVFDSSPTTHKLNICYLYTANFKSLIITHTHKHTHTHTNQLHNSSPGWSLNTF